MGIINKLSQKEKNLIYILSIMVIFVVSYRLGFVHLTNKADELYSENLELSAKLVDLQVKAQNKEKYIEETNQMNEDIDNMLNKLPTSLAQEKSTMFVIDLEKQAKMKVSAIAYGEVSEIYSSESETVDNSEEAATMTETTDASMSVEVESTDEKIYKGYKSSITINYQTTYAGLKSAIDYINQYNDKMKIQSLSAAFDNTTGNLTGTIAIDIFSLIGEGREVAPVAIHGVDIGTDNIFGTFEIPIE